MWLCTHAASLQQQLTLAQTVGAVGELPQRFLCLVSDGGVGRFIQLFAQDLKLGEALRWSETRRTYQGQTRSSDTHTHTPLET